MADNIEKLDTPEQGLVKSKGTPAKRKVRGSNRIARWFREMKSELRKVVWPSPKQITNNTFVALTVMTAAAIAIWALDFASNQIFRAIIEYIPGLLGGVQ